MNKYLFIEINTHRAHFSTETAVTEHYLDTADPLDAFKQIFLKRVKKATEEFFDDEVEPRTELCTSTEQEGGSTFTTVIYESTELGQKILVSSEM